MASRRDQLQSYQFRSQRVVTAFVMRETDPASSPLRRGFGALLVGAMVAVLVAAAFGVYGILTKTGGNTWKTDGAVVVEKETGAVFVYAQGKLHPTLNYASALLAAAQSPPSVYQVPAHSLAGTPRTTVIGIPGAPTSLPDRSHLDTAPWTICSAETGTDPQNPTTAVFLSIGAASGGETTLGADDGILAEDSGVGDLYLIWHAHRYRVAQSVRVPLFADIATVPVGAALLNALPAGRDIDAINVPNAGQPSRSVPGHDNGDVLVAQTGSGPLYYLVFGDGVAPISELQKDSLAVGTPQPIDVATAQALPVSSHLPPVTGAQAPPLAPPHLAPAGQTGRVCAVFPTDGGDPRIGVGGTQTVSGVPTTKRADSGTLLADLVAVPAGTAALVVAQPSAGFAIGGWILVTDTGLRFSVPTADDVRYLGYDPRSAVAVPASVLARIPAGPALDHADASAAAGTP